MAPTAGDLERAPDEGSGPARGCCWRMGGGVVPAAAAVGEEG